MMSAGCASFHMGNQNDNARAARGTRRKFSVPTIDRKVGTIASQPRIGDIEYGIQLASSLDRFAGHAVYEVYLTNVGDEPIVFKTAEIDDYSLDLGPSEPIANLFKGRELPHSGARISPQLPADTPIIWSQMYPQPELAPGQAVSFQVCIDQSVGSGQQNLVLKDGQQNDYEFVLPAANLSSEMPAITMITSSLDKDRLYVKCQSSQPVNALWLNNVEQDGVKVLEDPALPSTYLLEVPLADAPDAGQPLAIRVSFEDGTIRQTLIRYLHGISLTSSRLPETLHSRDLNLDDPARVLMLPGDVVCDDIRNGRVGHSARMMMHFRSQIYDESPHVLTGIGYCTPTGVSHWNVYGATSDLVFSHTYQFGWGARLRWFIEDEEEHILNAQKVAAPRPVIWIPDPFRRRGRFMTFKEMEIQTWMVLMNGGKGVRWLTGDFHNDKQIARFWPNYYEWLTGFCKQIREIEPMLAAAVPMQVRIEGESTSRRKIYTAWSGRQGVLLFVRNLSYKSPSPRGVATYTPQGPLTISCSLPDWMISNRARNLLTGEPVRLEVNGNTIELALDNLGDYLLVWLPNEAMGE